MKIQITFAALQLISSSQQKRFVRPPTLHWNEDPTSVPNPLSGRLSITSSQARLARDGHSQLASEPAGDGKFFVPYNLNAPEPSFVFQGLADNESSDSSDYESFEEYISKPEKVSIPKQKKSNSKKSLSESESSSNSDSSDSEEDQNIKNKIIQLPKTKQLIQWQVYPDLGELDHTVVLREKDTHNGKKFSGWTNPLGWTDDGNDDDTVVLQMKDNILHERRFQDSSLLQYEQSEGPTKVDLGDSDHTVILREEDISNGKKFSGWTNPLGWTDDGQDDEYVL